MNVAWDGNYYYVAYGVTGPPFTFKVFNRDRTLHGTGAVGENTYSVMAEQSGTGIRSGTNAGSRVQISITPSPLASGLAILHFSPQIWGAAKLSIFDVAGRTMLSRTLVAGEDRSASVLDLRRLDAGVYVAELSSSGLTTTQKLVVER
jgi:hypothetical protein